MSEAKKRLNARSREELVSEATKLHKANNDLLWSLIQARQDAGYTQAELAEILGVTQPTVAKFESEDNDPRLSTITRYALAVGVKVSHQVECVDGTQHVSDGWIPMTVDGGVSYNEVHVTPAPSRSYQSPDMSLAA